MKRIYFHRIDAHLAWETIRVRRTWACTCCGQEVAKGQDMLCLRDDRITRHNQMVERLCETCALSRIEAMQI